MADDRTRFSDFIARALYDPQRGYYTRRIRDVGGSRGDFATSATLSQARLGSGPSRQWLRAEKQRHPACAT
jgi:SAM-dependent MidA family methyltransferase